MKYDYKCDECNHIWTVNHSMKINSAVEELGLKCENCESVNIKKYLGNYTTATITFKGMGWAQKDLLLDKIGMPKATQDSPEARKAMAKRL